MHLAIRETFSKEKEATFRQPTAQAILSHGSHSSAAHATRVLATVRAMLRRDWLLVNAKIQARLRGPVSLAQRQAALSQQGKSQPLVS